MQRLDYTCSSNLHHFKYKMPHRHRGVIAMVSLKGFVYLETPLYAMMLIVLRLLNDWIQLKKSAVVEITRFQTKLLPKVVLIVY